MKKSKPLSLHHIQTTSPSVTKKKSPLSVKQKTTKSPTSKKSTQTFKPSPQPQDYIIINDNIYSANTFTQRNCYDQFLSKVKKQKQEQRKSFLFKQTLDDSQSAKLKKGRESTKKKFKKLSPQDLIKCMSLDEKREMFYKLQQEIKQRNGVSMLPVELGLLSENNKESQPCSTQSFENELSGRMRVDSERQREEKYRMLQEKLQSLKMQLIFKWQGQLQRLQQLFRKGKISENEKEKKSIIIEKLKDHKLKIIECTKTLFQKILQQDSNQEEQTQKKNDKIQAILQSLHSLPSLQSLKDQQIDKQPNIDHLKVNQKQKLNQNQLSNENHQYNTNQLIIIQKNKNNLDIQSNIKNNQLFYTNKNKILASIDSSPLQIVEDKQHEAFLSEFNQDIQNKKIKIRQQLLSPLNFVNNSPNNNKFNDFQQGNNNKFNDFQESNNNKFTQFQQVTTIVNTNYNNLPTKSQQMLRQLLEIQDQPKKNKQNKTNLQKDNKQFINNLQKGNKQPLSKFGVQNAQNVQNSKLSLKLDLRLDEIVFGQDQYPQCEKDQNSKIPSDSQINNFNKNKDLSDTKIEQYINPKIDQYIKPKIDQYINPKIDTLQGLSLKREERIIRDTSKTNKKRSLIQFTQEKIQSDQIIQQQIQIIQEQIQIEEDKTQNKGDKIQNKEGKIKEEEKIQIKEQIKQQQNIKADKISLSKLNENTIQKQLQDKNNTQQQKLSLVDLSKTNIIKTQQTQITPPQFKISFQKQTKTQQIPSINQHKQLTLNLQQKQLSLNLQQKQTPITQDHSLDQLECHEQTHNQKPIIDIPLILSQEKMETLALQQNRLFRQNIDKRIAFQMGCIQLEPSQSSSPHFTTLVDINSYIVGLYEFMMKKYMSSLVDSLNIPYGKSAIDKLYSLHTEGFVLQESYNQMNNILSESHFKEYQRQMALTVRRCSQYETAHNRAVFEAFTKSINVYRPYYELEGEVFPWIVSQKGITFYEITQDNIEEVFQKSKIKVLQYCTSLCGIHPPSQLKNDEQIAIVNNKNQQNLNKIIKAQTLQLFEEWKIRFVNFDCLVKILLGKLVYEDILNEVISQLQAITNKKSMLQE